MSMSINTSHNSLIFRNALQKSISLNQNIVGRLSSGIRINSASDDAAGLGLSKKILSAKNGNEVAKSNTQTGIAMLNTADGALDNMVSSLQRIRDLAVQASNGTYSRAERAMMQAETTQISSGVKQAYQTTTFGDKKIFRGEQASATEYADAIAAGYTDDRIIKTAAEFVSKITANTGGSFKLIADLDMSQLGTLTASAIASFTGQLEGNGHQISNLTINSTASNVGLFGQTNGVTIQNLAIENASVVSTGSNVGALVGDSISSTITNTSSSGSVSGASGVGGLVGSGIVQISDSYSLVSVSGTVMGTGGLVGITSLGSSIDRSYATGSVKGGSSNSGGLVGANSAVITASYANGNVSGTQRVGGLIGTNYNVGISQSYATGNVAGTSMHSGGFVAVNWGDITDSYSLGNISGTILTGGFVGQMSSGSVTNSYTTGIVSSTTTPPASFCATGGAGTIDETNFYKNNGTYSSGSAVNANTTPPPTGSWSTAVWDISSDTPELKTAGLVVATSATPNGSATGIQIGANADAASAIQANASFNIGNLNFNVRTQYAALQTIGRIDQTIASLNATRSDIGSQTNKLSLTLDNQDARIDNYAQSNSVIGDANIATESANLTKQQILQNFSTSVYQQSSNFDQNMIMSIYNNL